VFWEKVTALVLNTAGLAEIMTTALFSTATIRVLRLFQARWVMGSTGKCSMMDAGMLSIGMREYDLA
jgi:hypothetical protein